MVGVVGVVQFFIRLISQSDHQDKPPYKISTQYLKAFIPSWNLPRTSIRHPTSDRHPTSLLCMLCMFTLVDQWYKHSKIEQGIFECLCLWLWSVIETMAFHRLFHRLVFIQTRFQFRRQNIFNLCIDSTDELRRWNELNISSSDAFFPVFILSDRLMFQTT